MRTCVERRGRGARGYRAALVDSCGAPAASLSLKPCGRRQADGRLNLKGDRYPQENILIHEFAHVIHEMGLNALDDEFDGRLLKTYRQAIDNGLWKGTYAATNHKEYWAEGVQSY